MICRIVIVCMLLELVCSNLYASNGMCPAQSRNDVENALKTMWVGISEALKAGNQQSALSYISIYSKKKYKQLFMQENQNDMKRLYESYAGFMLESYDEFYAQGGVIMNEPEGKYSYPVIFVRDPDCKWRIRDF